jgi:hypothetical protein
MASEVKTNKISPATGTDVTLGDASDTFTVPSGSAITVASGGDINVASGGEIDIASGATLDVNGTIDVTGATTTGFPSSGFSKWTPVTASDSTFDLQSGTTKVILEVQASGGAGGTSDVSGNNAGSGGAGAYAKKLLTGMTGATDKLDITIGAVAAAAASGTVTSVAQAGTASFTTVTCTGGAGGAAGAVEAEGGAGGVIPTTGDLNIAGQNGLPGASFGYAAGPGSNSMFGFGGIRKEGSLGVGQAATGYGSGGGQARPSGSMAGGAGGAAIVIVWEFK